MDPTDRLDSNCRFYAMAVRDCNGRGLGTRSLDMRLGRMEVLSLEVRSNKPPKIISRSSHAKWVITWHELHVHFILPSNHTLSVVGRIYNVSRFIALETVTNTESLYFLRHEESNQRPVYVVFANRKKPTCRKWESGDQSGGVS